MGTIAPQRRRPPIVKTLVFLLLASCGAKTDAPAGGADAARKALSEGSPRRALSYVQDATSGPELVLRLRAQIGIQEWGSVETLLGKLPDGNDKLGVACLLASARRDMSAFRQCEAAVEKTYDDPVLGDEVAHALAKAYELEHRPEPAEKVLKDLLARRPEATNRRALADFYDRQGFVKDAVDVMEAWVIASPEDPTLKPRLAQLLERKLRGDLLDKRYVEAEAAARRCLALAPARQEVRYYLADALEGQGKKAEAEAERKALTDAKVKKPPSVDAFPGMEPDTDTPPKKPPVHNAP